MSPGYKTAKPKEIPIATVKQTSNKDKTNKVNTDTRLNYPTFQAKSKLPVKSKSKKADKVRVENDFLQKSSFKLTNTASEVPLTEGMNTDAEALKPKSKWLAKREQEMLKLQTRTRSELTLFSLKKKHDSETCKNSVKNTPLLEKKITSGQKILLGINLVSHPLQTVSPTTDCETKPSVPTFKAANLSEQIQNNPKHWTKEYHLDSRIKEQDGSVLKTKTCVWDHIKHGLYNKRHDDVPVLLPTISAHKVSLNKCVTTSESVLKPHTRNDQNGTMNNPLVQFPFFQASVQRRPENTLNSQLQNMSVMGYSPEMATGYGGTFFFSSRSELSSNEDFLMKYQSASKPSPKGQGRVL